MGPGPNVFKRVQVLVRDVGIKANSCYKSYPSVLIIINSFSVCVDQSGYLPGKLQ